MRVLVQRVTEAAVEVDGHDVGSVGRGLVALVGIGRGDDAACARKMADKVADLRMFEDAAGKTNLSLLDVGGSVLVVSQFTLYADCRKGRRPSFTDAGEPGLAAELVGVFRSRLEERGVRTASGVFGARMSVRLVNDGPFTLFLDSREVS